jgi:hypothetical protein
MAIIGGRPLAWHVALVLLAVVSVRKAAFVGAYNGYPSISGMCGANDAMNGYNKPNFGHFKMCTGKKKARDLPYFDRPPPDLNPKISIEAQWANCSTVIPPDMDVPWPSVITTGSYFDPTMKPRDWAYSLWGK